MRFRHSWVLACVALSAGLAACSSKSGGEPVDAAVVRADRYLPPAQDAGDEGSDAGPARDAGVALPDSGVARDAGIPEDAGVFDPCVGCLSRELCGPSGDGDGVDNNCNGEVDETCTCMPGSARSCFAGRPEFRGVGACTDGSMRCGEFGAWGPCLGGTAPAAEVCDSVDNDCDGAPDDGLAGCATSLSCPGPEFAEPLTTHPLSGAGLYAGTVNSWHWSIVSCPASFGGHCPEPDAANDMNTSVYFVASGTYRVRVEMMTADAGLQSCEWPIRVQGRGLRVELTWDTQGSGRGNTDVDLHLHRRSTAPGTATGETGFFNADDCYYANCKASDYSTAVTSAWMLTPNADLGVCRDAPHGEGAQWATRGQCYNPRLDVDVISCNLATTIPSDGSYCAPENINIDSPPYRATYRVGVDYFSSAGHSGATHPVVNIYCDGELRGSFGADPVVELRESKDFWIVADVEFELPEDTRCGAVSCRIRPINIVQRPSGGSVPFGPDWSF